jgi:hypothetical protein
MALTQVVGGLIAPSTTLTAPIVATTMGVGGATPSGSGSGISFPATQSASSDANTLDDYEEGNWTASVGGNTTYNARTGKYIKVGKMVFVEGRLHINLIGTGSTYIVSGLPFTSASQPTGERGTLSVNSFYAIANNVVYLAMYIDASATTAVFQALSSAATSVSTIGIFGNNADVYFSGCYYAAN